MTAWFGPLTVPWHWLCSLDEIKSSVTQRDTWPDRMAHGPGQNQVWGLIQSGESSGMRWAPDKSRAGSVRKDQQKKMVLFRIHFWSSSGSYGGTWNVNGTIGASVSPWLYKSVFAVFNNGGIFNITILHHISNIMGPQLILDRKKSSSIFVVNEHWLCRRISETQDN